MNSPLSAITSQVSSALSEGTSFGTTNVTRVGGFTLKILLLLIPGTVLGHYTDQYIEKLRKQRALGDSLFKYIAAQTLLDIGIIYVLSRIHQGYTMEFQNTYAGLFFVSLFFGMQSNYVGNLQSYLGKMT